MERNNDNMLCGLDGFTLDNSEDIAMDVAQNFRRRRVEKNITRQRIAELAGVPLPTVARFEQKGQIGFEALVKLAMALGHTADVKGMFAEAKFSTMAELDLIRSKMGKKRAWTPKEK